MSGVGAHDEYILTPKGEALWPVVSGLAQWGSAIGPNGACTVCGVIPEARDVVIQRPRSESQDPFDLALREPHPLLEPLRPQRS